MSNWPGNLICKTPVIPTTSSAPGMWTLAEASYWTKQGLWPLPSIPDPFFSSVTYLMATTAVNNGQNNTFLDSSANNFTITRNGNTTQGSFSPYGNSAYFDGTGDYLNVAAATQLSFTGDYTIEGWLYITDTTASYKRIFQNAPGTAPTGYFYVYNNGTNIVLYNVDAGTLVTAGSFTASTWFHLAICRSGSTTRVFINGVQTFSYAGTTSFTNNGWFVGGGPSSEFMGGYVSNHRVVVGSALYTSNFTPPTTPPTAVSGTQLLMNFANANVFDSAKANNTETVADAKVSTSVSKFGGSSVAFDGTGDYLVNPSSSNVSFGTGNFTIEFWVNLTSIGAGTTMVDTRTSGDLNGVSIFTYSGGVGFDYPGSFAAGGSPLPTGVFTFIALVRNGTTITVYVNGVSTATATTSASITASSLQIGRKYTGAEFVNGYIDEFRVTKGVARYTANFTPPTAAFPTS
jgi:hypothetical protein